MNELTWLPQIDPSTCTGCGECIALCRPNALARMGTKAVVARPGACTYCAVCEALCPVGAISLPYVIVFDAPAPPPAPAGP